MVLRAPFDQFHLFIALEEPVHDRKQGAHESPHMSAHLQCVLSDPRGATPSGEEDLHSRR